jgi:hypothetical protein
MSRATIIFREVLEVPVDRRSDFLAEACGGDSDLQARVQELLDSAEDTNSLTAAQQGDRIPPPQPSLPIFAAGEVVDNRYEVIRFIAKGGMGEVYEVEDRELKTRVALKTVTLSPVLSAHLMIQFKREIQLARKVVSLVTVPLDISRLKPDIASAALSLMILAASLTVVFTPTSFPMSSKKDPR